MFKTSNDWKGLVVRSTEGELGTVDDLYFDDETWAIRYLTLETKEGGVTGAVSAGTAANIQVERFSLAEATSSGWPEMTWIAEGIPAESSLNPKITVPEIRASRASVG
jgi:hypothetical protein